MPPINNNNTIYSVSQITSSIKHTLESNTSFRYVRVEGEISDFRKYDKSYFTANGRRVERFYFYFTLKDDECKIPVVMFSGTTGLGFEVKDGIKAVCSGTVEVYEKSGRYQLKGTSLSETGEGRAARDLEALKRRLADEGLFDQHRSFPKFPKKIAVVTSASGAVRRDIETVIERRYPIVEICLIPAAVQGENAVPSLISGIERAQNIGADLIIFGRGGGSDEDLSCFNSEELVRVIHASRIPTISAVGHQVDYTIADLAADLRAATPTEAAEKATPNIEELLSVIEKEKETSKQLMGKIIMNLELRLSVSEKEIRLYSPRGKINMWEQSIARDKAAISAEIKRKLELADRQVTAIAADNRSAITGKLARAETELRETAGSISAMDPLGVLSRGYSLTESGGRVITDSKMLKKGDTVKVRLEKGSFGASVTEIDE